MRIHLLVDWENKRPTGAELEQVRGSRYRLWILHGPQQGSFPAEQVNAWQPLGKQVRFVQSAKAGKIGYLEVQGIRTRRAESLTEALGIAAKFAEDAKADGSTTPQLTVNAQRAMENLRAAEANNRPTNVKRLTNHVATLLAMKADDPAVAQVLEELKRAKVLKVSGTKPEYTL